MLFDVIYPQVLYGFCYWLDMEKASVGEAETAILQTEPPICSETWARCSLKLVISSGVKLTEVRFREQFQKGKFLHRRFCRTWSDIHMPAVRV